MQAGKIFSAFFMRVFFSSTRYKMKSDGRKKKFRSSEDRREKIKKRKEEAFISGTEILAMPKSEWRTVKDG